MRLALLRNSRLLSHPQALLRLLMMCRSQDLLGITRQAQELYLRNSVDHPVHKYNSPLLSIQPRLHLNHLRPQYPPHPSAMRPCIDMQLAQLLVPPRRWAQHQRQGLTNHLIWLLLLRPFHPPFRLNQVRHHLLLQEDAVGLLRIRWRVRRLDLLVERGGYQTILTRTLTNVFLLRPCWRVPPPLDYVAPCCGMGRFLETVLRPVAQGLSVRLPQIGMPLSQLQMPLGLSTWASLPQLPHWGVKSTQHHLFTTRRILGYPRVWVQAYELLKSL